ncbi:MAG: hypothetical protein Kow0056_09190 [Coriobacteriia bacterium]
MSQYDEGITWFPSKVDWWLGVLLAVAPGICVYILLASLVTSDQEGITAGLTSCAFIGAIYLLLVIPVRYGIGPDTLIIRFGVVRQQVRLGDIVEVKPTNNPLSSPALSLDRLAVRTGKGPFRTTMISPDERDTFLAMLATAAGLEREGDRLVRSGRNGRGSSMEGPRGA